MYQYNLTMKNENKDLKQSLQQLEVDNNGKGKLDFLVEATEI
jgi:hypothetical protein